MVLDAAQHLGMHLARLERAQRGAQSWCARSRRRRSRCRLCRSTRARALRRACSRRPSRLRASARIARAPREGRSPASESSPRKSSHSPSSSRWSMDAGDGEALLEVLARLGAVGHVQGDLAQVTQPDRLADPVADRRGRSRAPPRRIRAPGRRRLRAGAPSPAWRAWPRHRRDCRSCAEARDRARASARLGVVALVVREHGADVERVRVRDVRRDHAGQRERGVDVLAAFGRISAQETESLQRDLELHGEDGVRAAAERQRDGGAQVVELGFEPARPSRLVRALQPIARRLGDREVVVAVALRVRGAARRACQAPRARTRAASPASGSAIRRPSRAP